MASELRLGFDSVQNGDAKLLARLSKMGVAFPQKVKAHSGLSLLTKCPASFWSRCAPRCRN
jgi:hypothetical protein